MISSKPATRIVGLVAAAFIVTAFLLQVSTYWPFKVDDAYISFVYSKNLAEGHGLTYNGSNVEGFSSFLWTVLIAPFILWGMEPMIAARMLSIAAALATLYVTGRLFQRLEPQGPRLAIFVAVLLLASSVPFVAWSVGGLETVWVSCWTTLLVYLEANPKRDRPMLSALVVLVCALSRPEGMMVFPIVLVYRLACRKRVQSTVRWAIVFLVPFTLFVTWRYLTYGYLLPNTAYLKVEPGLETAWMAARWLASFVLLRPTLGLLVFLSVLSLIQERNETARGWYLVLAFVGAYVAFVLYSGYDWMPHHRFLVPVLPLLCVLAGRGQSVGFRMHRQWLRRLAMVGAMTTVVVETVLSTTLFLTPCVALGKDVDALISAGKWIQQNTDPESVIAVVDAGALAYYGERPTIDILGLCDERIAHSPDKSDPDYVLAHQPLLMQFHVGEGDLLYMPKFMRLYEPVVLGDTAEKPAWLAFYIRRSDQ